MADKFAITRFEYDSYVESYIFIIGVRKILGIPVNYLNLPLVKDHWEAVVIDDDILSEFCESRRLQDRIIDLWMADR